MKPPVEEVPGSGFAALARRLWIPALLGVLAFLLLALFADARELASEVRGFDVGLLGPVLALSIVNYLLRFVRWEWYLKTLEVTLPRAQSLAVFLFGFVLSVTPGKAGELGKAWMVRELGGGRARRVVSAVLAERLTDLMGVVLLASLGLSRFTGGIWVAAVGASLCLAVLAVLAWPAVARRLLRSVQKLPFAGNRVHVVEEIYDRLRVLSRPSLLLAAVILSVVAWGAEGVGFYLIVRHYQPAVELSASVFNYGFSTLVGALSMLPGGLLASEGTLTALLDAQGLERAAAASATLITRAATLWFAVALGLLALAPLSRAVRRRSGEAGLDVEAEVE